MINIFFQEWAPLFPVLHRPTFLNLYTEYAANPEGLKNQQSIAQLNLVFGIATLSAEVESSQLCRGISTNSQPSVIHRMLLSSRNNGKRR